MTAANVEEFIEHFGTKGMKWGVRKAESGPPPRVASEHKKAREIQVKGTSTKPRAAALTNKQLKEFNERAQLEKKFNDMNPGSIDKGHAQIKKMLAIAATGAAAWKLLPDSTKQQAIKRGKTAIQVIVKGGKLAPVVPV